MTDKIALEDWLRKESQFTSDGFVIWRNDHIAARARALREALRVLPERTLPLLGITTAENRTCDFDGYFGVCPHCQRHDGFINIGRSHWVFLQRAQDKMAGRLKLIFIMAKSDGGRPTQNLRRAVLRRIQAY